MLWDSPIENRKDFVKEWLLEKTDYAVLNSGKLTYQQFSIGMSHMDKTLVNSKIVAKCNVSVLNKCLFQYGRYLYLTFLLGFVFVFLKTITSSVFKSHVINKRPLSLYICQLASSTFQRECQSPHCILARCT